jgi:hypothetical protein
MKIVKEMKLMKESPVDLTGRRRRPWRVSRRARPAKPGGQIDGRFFFMSFIPFMSFMPSGEPRRQWLAR